MTDTPSHIVLDDFTKPTDKRHAGGFEAEVADLLAGRTVFLPGLWSSSSTVMLIRYHVKRRTNGALQLVSRKHVHDSVKGVAMWAEPAP